MPSRKSWKGCAVTPEAACLFSVCLIVLVSKGECSVDTKNMLADSRNKTKSQKVKKTAQTMALERTQVIRASLQKWFVCHPSRFRARFVISCDVCARTHVGSLPTSVGGFLCFLVSSKSKKSKKQHKPWQFQRTHVNDASL